MPDPRVNCAAEICCDPHNARAARIDLLFDLGCPQEYCERVADAMPKKGIAFTSTDLMKAIAEIADHPNLSA